jgi:hypothetical protein
MHNIEHAAASECAAQVIQAPHDRLRKIRVPTDSPSASHYLKGRTVLATS